MANPRSAAAKRLLKGAQQQKQAKNKKATASTMKNMKSVAKGTYANRSNSKAAEANVKSPVKATKKPATKKATTKKTNYDSMSFSKAFAAARKAAKAGGSKTFPWRGKTYGTKLKSEVKAKVPKKKVDVTYYFCSMFLNNNITLLRIINEVEFIRKTSTPSTKYRNFKNQILFFRNNNIIDFIGSFFTY